MLLSLGIRDIVLIQRLDLEFGPGLNVLTGETGAGKSIVLDALGLALGLRADAGLVRDGAEQGVISAAFEVAPAHGARALLQEHGLDQEGPVLVRRVVESGGRSRAFVNDQPVSVALLRGLGETLVEVHGTSDHAGLLNNARHRLVLDAFGQLEPQGAAVAERWRRLREAEGAVSEAESRMARARGEEDYLRHALAELDELRPEPGEEGHLAEQRTRLNQSEKLAAALSEAEGALVEAGGVTARLGAAERTLSRLSAQAGGRLDEVVAALARAAIEAGEAAHAVAALRRELDDDPERLQRVEERLFELRALARKHRVPVDGLAALRDDIAARLAALDDGAADLERLRAAAAEARESYGAAATALGAARRKAADKLAKRIDRELSPLKLEHTRFEPRVEALPEADWGQHGAERVAFYVATNPGAAPGPLARIASGGEQSRLMLALKVAVASARSAPTLIFDEIDRGIGGATADAVGVRLARLSEDAQVLVVTHSPQVAARAHRHWRVGKHQDGAALTWVEELDAAGRREEIARMLAGAQITQEARAAADSLIHGPQL